MKRVPQKGVATLRAVGQLFNTNTATGFLQISSAQSAPNSSEEQELDVAFLSLRVHVNVNADSVDDVEKLPHRVKGKAGGDLKSGQLN